MIIRIIYTIKHIIHLKILKTKMIYNYSTFCKTKKGHALLYYKIEPFINQNAASDYYHTNNKEILIICKVLNRLGFIVDILDRKITNKDILNLDDKYDIFIGLGAGNSGKYFADIAKKLSKATKILLAAGPEPSISNKLITERYSYFYERHKTKMRLLRMITAFHFKDFIKTTDYLLVIGGKFALSSYAGFNKPILKYYPLSSEKLTKKTNINQSQLNKFLYFGGNGNIVKGLDLVIDTFSKSDKLELYICAPQNETDFNNYYSDKLKKAKNIHNLGFIKPGGKKFNEVTQKCGFVILPSCKEGVATSVVTCMRRGLIPVVTYETGIETKDFGFLLKNVDIDYIYNLVHEISNMSFEEFKNRVEKTYKFSEIFTITNFEKVMYDNLKQITSS